MLLVPIGGLANRIFAIRAAISFCADYHLKLKILWFKDWGMAATFEELFSVRKEAGEVEIIDAKWWHYFLDRPRKRTLWLPWFYQRITFDACFYEKDLYGQSSFMDWYGQHMSCRSLYVVQCMKFYQADRTFFRYLLPAKNIREEIALQVAGFSCHTIGVHIRRTDFLQAIKESPLCLFMAKMKEVMEKDNAVRFYLATDSMEVKEDLLKTIGGGGLSLVAHLCEGILGRVSLKRWWISTRWGLRLRFSDRPAVPIPS